MNCENLNYCVSLLYRFSFSDSLPESCFTKGLSAAALWKTGPIYHKSTMIHPITFILTSSVSNEFVCPHFKFMYNLKWKMIYIWEKQIQKKKRVYSLVVSDFWISLYVIPQWMMEGWGVTHNIMHVLTLHLINIIFCLLILYILLFTPF